VTSGEGKYSARLYSYHPLSFHHTPAPTTRLLETGRSLTSQKPDDCSGDPPIQFNVDHFPLFTNITRVVLTQASRNQVMVPDHLLALSSSFLRM
jgi:hypothetical protein